MLKMKYEGGYTSLYILKALYEPACCCMSTHDVHYWSFKLTSQDEVSWYAGFRHTAVITAGAVPDSMHWAETPDAIAAGQPSILNVGML